MPAPIILRPTAPAFVNDAPMWGPLDGPPHHRNRVMRAARWWATCPEDVARAGALYMLGHFDRGGPGFLKAYQGTEWDKARADAGERDLFARVPDYFYDLTRAGVDPPVLLALRGTRLTHANRILIACSGLTPAEAHAMHEHKTLDIGVVRAMMGATTTVAMTAGPTAIILRPTSATFINSDPGWGPLDGSTKHREKVMQSARWWADSPDRVARAVAEYMLDLFDRTTTMGGVAGQRLERARQEAGGRDLFEPGPDHFNWLTKVGVDPVVLLALRQTSLTHSDRLLVASVGLSPAEAHTMYASGALDMDMIRTMGALRRRR